MDDYKRVIQKWREIWEIAIYKWTKFTRLREPFFITTEKEREQFGLGELFSMIRLTDQSIIIDVPKVLELGLENYILEIFCHEIGHHISYPSNLTDMGRMLIRIKKVLTFPSLTHYTNFVGNIYTDLLINHKLKIEFELKIDEIYLKLKPPKVDEFWNFYMRIYELLWALPKNNLTTGEISSTMEADAMLGNRLIRNYSVDWIRGAGKFASLCIPYLMDSKSDSTQRALSVWLDNSSVNDNKYHEVPQTLLEYEEIDEFELQHPAMDSDFGEQSIKKKSNSQKQMNSSLSNSRLRNPLETREIVEQLGISFDLKSFISAYYKQLALPYLIPFPTKVLSQSREPLLEGTENWDIGSPIENINWFQTTMKNAVVIPGYTILEDYFGEDKGNEISHEKVDLDIYVDCSGSMPNPSNGISYLALAGTIIVLSALRAGCKVQATLWSGLNEVLTTKGFIDEEKKLLEIVTGYLGFGTQFPLQILNETYSKRKSDDKKVHILVISDDGIDTMLAKIKNLNGAEVSKMAIQKAGGGASMVLNLPSTIESYPEIQKLQKHGWEIYRVTKWEELLQFAKSFVEKNYKK